MEKKIYETAEMEVINVEQDDVICASTNSDWFENDTSIVGPGLN